MRVQGIGELLFVLQKGIAQFEIEAIQAVKEREFIAGQNLYWLTLTELVNVVLMLLGEKGRSVFLSAVSETLDAYGSEIQHRRAWADLLEHI